MATWFKLLLALFIGLVAFKFRVNSSKSSSSEPDDNDDNEKENLTIAWIYKPPYIRGPDNSSLDIWMHGCKIKMLAHIHLSLQVSLF